MKIKISVFLILSVIFLNPASGQKAKHTTARQPTIQADYNITGNPLHSFTFLWKQVDSLTNLGQPKSALDLVNKIYLRAKTENNDPQVIKAVIYRIRLNSDFQENFLENTIAELHKEIPNSAQPAKQVFQSILAEVYWKYYQNNQYRFRDRTQVKSNIADSIGTWDLVTIFRTITRMYLLSLENADSMKCIPIKQYEAILDREVLDSKQRDTRVAGADKFIPTLYDFLAGRALEFFTSELDGLRALQIILRLTVSGISHSPSPLPATA
jgi:hypothetical protein